MEHSFHYPSEDVLRQIQERVERNAQHTLEIPSQTECFRLRDAALNGDEIAVERVYNLYHFAQVPTSAQQRVALAVIFDVYQTVNKKLV